MPNLSRNDLTITGDNAIQVLDFIDFDPLTPVSFWPDWSPPTLIDFNRIVPEPRNEPDEGRREWRYNNWGTPSLYDGYRNGDILELTSNKVSFQFYTVWAPAYQAIKALAKRFPEFRFHYRGWDQTNHHIGTVIWEKGQPTVVVPMYYMKLRKDCDVPAFDPVTPDILSTAKHLVEQVYNKSDIIVPVDTEAIEVVSEALAVSGSSAKLFLNVVPKGAACLIVAVVDLKEQEIRQKLAQIIEGAAR
jgi:hypothetical protein